MEQDNTISIGTAPHLRWGVIGCGVIANQMAEALALEGRTLAGVANRTLPKAQAFAERHHVQRVYESIDELIQSPDIDAIWLTTPHNTHIQYLRPALAAGKHVLCEKSITLNSSELDEARWLATQNNVQLMDANTILHMPLYRELLRRAESGEFGPMNLAQLNFGSYKEYNMSNRFFNPKLAGGALLDIGVYSLTLARLFMKSGPNDVVSIMNSAPTGVDETSGIVMRNPEGQMAVLSLTLHSKQPKRAMLSFDKCYIEVMEYPRADSAKIVWTEDGRVEEVHAGKTPYALCYEMADMESAVAGDETARGLMRYTVDVMSVMTRLRNDWQIKYPEEM
jgi:predicted dehydrogenase